MEVFISAGTHSFTDTDSRIRECEERLGNPDVIFIEKPITTPSWKERAKGIFFAPLLMLTTHLWVDIVLRLSTAFFGDDDDIKEHFKETYDADVVPVDIPHIEHIQEQMVLWTTINWLAIIWPTVIFSPSALISGYSYISVIVFQGIIIFISYLAGVHSFRNWFMADQIVSYSNRYSKACFVTGKQHYSEVADRLSGYESVEIMNKP